MWSGPRNLSTALMYAFAARQDCAVVDEPFYAPYLLKTGADHPMRDTILAKHDTDAARVASILTGPVPGGRTHFYQKHMVHHMCAGFMPDWPPDTRHVFLIRHPARVVASYAAKRELPKADDLGFVDQHRLFGEFSKGGAPPIVIDSEAIRRNPEGALSQLCQALGLAFDPAMLSWPAGGNPADGVWAAHWYGAVHRSTGFAGAEGPLPQLDDPFAARAAEGMAVYDALRQQALTVR